MVANQVFKLTPNGKETLLHSFGGSDGAFPAHGHLLMDDNGTSMALRRKEALTG